jgi:hypothetical protein
MVRIGKYDYQKSNKPDKKLVVVVEHKGKKKTIHFGARNMEHFKDRTGIWKSKDHNDSKRRKNFKDRMGGIKLKDGSRAIDNPLSPAYHALRILW